MPTFELTPILEAAAAVGTVTDACESATSLVEVEFAKVPSEPPAGCLTDVLAQKGMCALFTQARLGCQHRFVSGVILSPIKGHMRLRSARNDAAAMVIVVTRLISAPYHASRHPIECLNTSTLHCATPSRTAAS